MAGCCGGSGCGCKVSAGTGIAVTGSGSASDPFVVTANVGLAVQDTTDFNLTLTGAGTIASPWTISLTYAATAKLDDIPDVNAAGPPNGYVLAWSSATQTWVAQAPTTAASGSVQHNTSLSGDGSAGTPLAVVVDTARLVGSTATGVGLTDTGMNSVVRRFVDATARASATPVPVVDSLSMLDSNAGQIDYWDGTQWLPVRDRFDTVVTGGQLLQLSGPYAGTRLTHIVKQIASNSDGGGLLDILDPTDLAGRGGVLSCSFQETGGTVFQAMVYPNTDRISASCWLATSTGLVAFAGVPVSGVVDAWVY